MRNLVNEVNVNFESFDSSWRKRLDEVASELKKYSAEYAASYQPLVSLQAWKADLLEANVDSKALAFFIEAQNDGLVSHVLAALGSWRGALQALRSCIENVCFCLYYKDHPVELELWDQGKHRLGFASMHEYLEHHPAVAPVLSNNDALTVLKSEYGTLSRAVHASGATFRMAGTPEDLNLWIGDKARLGSWMTRERQTLMAINLLLLMLFRVHLQGAAVPGLRKAISLAVPTSKHSYVKTVLKVTLFKKS